MSETSSIYNDINEYNKEDKDLTDISIIWNKIKESIVSDLGITDVSYNTWIVPLTYREIRDNKIVISVPFSKSTFGINYINNNFKKYFLFKIKDMLGDDYDLIFESDSSFFENSVKDNNDNKKDNTSIYFKSNLFPKYNFERFVVGKTNNFAQQVAVAVAENPGEEYNPLFIYGNPGLGKTHLMHAIGIHIINNNPDTKVLYVTCEEFTNEVIASLRNGKNGNTESMSNFREKYRNLDVLMIDDIQFIIGKDATQEEFFHTFNSLYTQNKQIIISSDRHPREFTTLDERFKSRFESGITVDIQVPDYETRMAILKNFADNENRNIDNNILEFIANNITSNIRILEGAFKKVIAFAKLNRIDIIDMDLVKEALRDTIGSSMHQNITIDNIMEAVSEHYNISIDDIKSKKRNKEIVEARHVFMYLSRKLLDTPYTSIGKYMNKDHSSVMHADQKIAEDIVINNDLKIKVDIITKKLN